jgi:hypothetical protein
MIKLSESGYTLRQNEASESLLTLVTLVTLVTMPDDSIEKVFGIPLCKENIFKIVAETRRNK